MVATPAVALDLGIATFNVDATPPVGSALCGGSVPPVIGVNDSLSARGLILLPRTQEPVVILVVDWAGIGNAGQTRWKQALAVAVGTSVDRVVVHAIHQHDAPFCDFSVEAIMAEAGLPGEMFEPAFAMEVIQRTAFAARNALGRGVPISHIGIGKAKVEKIASNRRILGDDGKVAQVRWTACTDPLLRAEPEGTIDPWLRTVSFWNGDVPVAILSHYATHPQSYYRTGLVSADFPGMARTGREKELPDSVHMHFNGAGGNIGAGKYNDGSIKNRAVLAGRLQDGMKKAFEATRKISLKNESLGWDTEKVSLPLRTEIDLETEKKRLADTSATLAERMNSAREIAWIERVRSDHPITISRLRVGPLQMMYMPGELFVEYQLAAQNMAPDDFVCMAAYGDYGPGYIGTHVSYAEGGYETGLHTSRTAPEVEGVLLNAMKVLLSR